MKYPYMVVRLITTVYQHIEIEEFRQELEKVQRIEKSLKGSIQKWVATTGFCACLVTGANEFFFVKPDGSVRHSTEPPSGGIYLKGR